MSGRLTSSGLEVAMCLGRKLLGRRSAFAGLLPMGMLPCGALSSAMLTGSSSGGGTPPGPAKWV